MKNREMEIAAIWLDRAVGVISGGDYLPTCRIRQGDLVKASNSAILPMAQNERPTHRILACFGTPTSSKLTAIVVDINTLIPNVINIMP